jgi:hypothetical protein
MAAPLFTAWQILKTAELSEGRSLSSSFDIYQSTMIDDLVRKALQ